MQILKTKGVWRLVLFVAATYALAVSADEVFTDASASRLNAHSMDSPYVNIGPDAIDAGLMIEPSVCSHLATMGSGISADYVSGMDADGNPVMSADVYPLSTPDIRPLATFDVPLSANTVQERRRSVSAGVIDIDLLSGAVTYNGVPLNLGSLSSLRRDCQRNFPDADRASPD